jgi:hypothetical protein
LLSRESGHGQAEEKVAKRSKRAEKIGRRPESFIAAAGGTDWSVVLKVFRQWLELWNRV